MDGLAPSSKVKDWHKAIFAVREIFQEHVYQTRGMACAVDVGSSVRLVTWRGVVDNADCRKNGVMDRFSTKSSTDVSRYRLQKSKVTTCGSFSFLSVNMIVNFEFPILRCEVPENEIKASDFTAYSFSGKNTIELKFRYNKTKKEHELITTGDEWKERVTEKTSLLGSPIVVCDKHQDRAVVGVVGVSDDGKIVPFFMTKKDLGEYNLIFIIMWVCDAIHVSSHQVEKGISFDCSLTLNENFLMIKLGSTIKPIMCPELLQVIFLGVFSHFFHSQTTSLE